MLLSALPTRGWAFLAATVGAVATNLGVRIAAFLPARRVPAVGVVAVVAIVGLAATT